MRPPLSLHFKATPALRGPGTHPTDMPAAGPDFAALALIAEFGGKGQKAGNSTKPPKSKHEADPLATWADEGGAINKARPTQREK